MYSDELRAGEPRLDSRLGLIPVILSGEGGLPLLCKVQIGFRAQLASYTPGAGALHVELRRKEHEANL
jgi:hypothetical protein